MTNNDDVFIVGAARTAIGDFGGALKDVSPAELGVVVVAEAIRRSGLMAADVQHVFVGQVIPTEPTDAYLARVIGVRSGIAIEAPALTINRLCGSGVQSIISAAQTLTLGEADVAVAAGAESMSRAPYMATDVRWGRKMGDGRLLDMMVGTLTDPFDNIHMGVTAENVADRYQISREAQDALAAESHKRAYAAITEGRFKEQIVPVDIKGRKGTVVFDTDEHVRADTTAGSLSKLKPAFRASGSVTAGNASGLNDGAAAVILATGRVVREKGLTPLARILAWGHAGVEPSVMGIGPIKAVPIALKRAGLQLNDIDIIEANEAFAAQACAVATSLGFEASKLNPNGSGIALGHPIGATGTILTVKAAYELKRSGGRYALITMCIGGGQGIALVIERTC